MYKSKLTINDTQKAIEEIKIHFPKYFGKRLSLTRVTAPLFLEPATGLNDGLNGETAVSFLPGGSTTKLEIVHSLAKWKRNALELYHFQTGTGIYTDMNAIRREEHLSQIHSYYVDQWDWEKAISKIDRTEKYLKETVVKIYDSIKDIKKLLVKSYPTLTYTMPEEIFFIDSQDLEDKYPNTTPEEREYLLVKEKGAIFVQRVGHKLKSGVFHSARAFDYDDWTLNRDIIVYHPVLYIALELSSMGIRVDSAAVVKQSGKTAEEVKSLSPFHKGLVEETLPFSIGGGIGQSRLCMYVLEKHTSEKFK